MRVVAILLAAVVGFVVFYFASYVIGVGTALKSECDGVCYDELETVAFVSVGVGALGAVLFGWAMRAWLRRSEQEGSEHTR